jgi:energy-coupling factor transporter ATP-binding protein EcfA2
MAITLCGSPQLSVLDEPSAGVDAAARKKLWRITNLGLKQGHSAILTTHTMSEAAQLGARVAIMVQGRLACVGSPQHLKELYGTGYDLMLKMTEGHSAQDVIVPAVQQVCPQSQLVESASDTYVKLSLGRAGHDFSLAELYSRLEELKDEAGLLDYSTSQGDLEQVFLRFAKLGGDETVQENHSWRGKPEVSTERQIKLLALLSQAKQGDASAEFKGSCWDPEGKKIWLAWTELRGSTVAQAKMLYTAESEDQRACFKCDYMIKRGLPMRLLPDIVQPLKQAVGVMVHIDDQGPQPDQTTVNN